MRDYLYIALTFVFGVLSIGALFTWQKNILPSTLAISLMVIFGFLAATFLIINNVTSNEELKRIENETKKLENERYLAEVAEYKDSIHYIPVEEKPVQRIEQPLHLIPEPIKADEQPKEPKKRDPLGIRDEDY